jgi:hypothetical protein
MPSASTTRSRHRRADTRQDDPATTQDGASGSSTPSSTIRRTLVIGPPASRAACASSRRWSTGMCRCPASGRGHTRASSADRSRAADVPRPRPEAARVAGVDADVVSLPLVVRQLEGDPTGLRAQALLVELDDAGRRLNRQPQDLRNGLGAAPVLRPRLLVRSRASRVVRAETPWRGRRPGVRGHVIGSHLALGFVDKEHSEGCAPAVLSRASFGVARARCYSRIATVSRRGQRLFLAGERDSARHWRRRATRQCRLAWIGAARASLLIGSQRCSPAARAARRFSRAWLASRWRR